MSLSRWSLGSLLATAHMSSWIETFIFFPPL